MKRCFVALWACGLSSGLVGAARADLNLNTSTWSVAHIVNTDMTLCFADANFPPTICVDQFFGPRNNRGVAVSPNGAFLYLGYGDPGSFVRKVATGQAPAANNTAVVAQLKLVVDPLAPGQTWAKSIATDDTGRVYFTQDVVIQVYDPNLTTRLLTITGFSHTNGVHVVRPVAGQPTLYVYRTERGASTGQLARMALDETTAFGGGTVAFSSVVDTSFGSAGFVDLVTSTPATDVRGLATDAGGDIWVADHGGTVFRVSSSGSILSTVAVPQAFDVYVDGNQVFVTQNVSATVAVIDRTTLVVDPAPIIPFAGLSLLTPPGISDSTLGGIDGVPGVALYTANEAGDSIDPSPFRTGATDDDDEPVLRLQPATVAGFAVADLDRDGDVDLLDFGLFRTAFTGAKELPKLSGQPLMGSAPPVAADFDGDGDVDLLDFATFRACFNGSNRPPGC